jgi:hypothetical protein
MGQTILSNESLVTTTFVVNKAAATARCGKPGCAAVKSMLESIPVNCPAPTGKTCTFHIALDAKVSMSFQFREGAEGSGPVGSYVFLIDGAPPTLGPTGAHGNYLFERNVITQSEQNKVPDRQSYPASVITSTQSGNHMIDVKIGCTDDLRDGGCEVTAHWSTLRVDVFEP